MSILLSFTMWLLAALVNGCLSGSILFAYSAGYNYWPDTFGFVFACSLFFSIPAIFILWIVLLVNWNDEILFRLLLKTGFILSAVSSLPVVVLPTGVGVMQNIALAACIVVSCITSIMIHYSFIVSIKIKPDSYV